MASSLPASQSAQKFSKGPSVTPVYVLETQLVDMQMTRAGSLALL